MCLKSKDNKRAEILSALSTQLYFNKFGGLIFEAFKTLQSSEQINGTLMEKSST